MVYTGEMPVPEKSQQSVEAEQCSGGHRGVLRGVEESKKDWVPFQKDARVLPWRAVNAETVNSVACRDLRFSLGTSK